MNTENGAIYKDENGFTSKLLEEKMLKETNKLTKSFVDDKEQSGPPRAPNAIDKSKPEDVKTEKVDTGFNLTGPQKKIKELVDSGKLVPIARLPRPDCPKCLSTGHIPPGAGAEKYTPCNCVKDRPDYNGKANES